MKRSTLIAALLSSTLAWASPPASDEPAVKTAAQTEAESAVQKKLIRPLAMKEAERSKFSRARLPATARRVRVTDTVARKDAQGQEFLAFSVDTRHGWAFDDDGNEKKAAWAQDQIVGCVYAATGEVFVKRGQEMRPAEMLLGKKTKAAAAHLCKDGGEQLAKK